MTMNINTTDTRMATVLAEIGDLDQGTLASLILRKKGVARGPRDARVIYDNDFVHVLVWTGFHYEALVERSHKKLHELWASGNLVKVIVKTLQDAGHTTITVEDVTKAIQELDDSFLKVINSKAKVESQGNEEQEAPDLTQVPLAEPDDPDPIWEPLKVDGKAIRGSKVYVGAGDLTDPRAPIKGTVYIDGVKLGEKILDPAPNGHWVTGSRPKTLAKSLLRSWLPIGLYVRYCLEPEGLLTAKVGKVAGEHAKSEGVLVDPEAIRSLFKIAP